jgi:phosphopantetheinyl transferase (holo-ACP synthase)
MSVIDKIDRILDESKNKLAEEYASNKQKHRYDDRALEYIAKTLTDKEWFALSIVIGFKPAFRIKELTYQSSIHNIPMSKEDYQAILKSLESKKVIAKGGRMAPQTRDVWNVKFPNVTASQTHQVVPKLKF